MCVKMSREKNPLRNSDEIIFNPRLVLIREDAFQRGGVPLEILVLPIYHQLLLLLFLNM